MTRCLWRACGLGGLPGSASGGQATPSNLIGVGVVLSLPPPPPPPSSPELTPLHAPLDILDRLTSVKGLPRSRRWDESLQTPLCN